MILKYLAPETPYSSTERVSALIGTGAIRRDQLLYLVSNCIQRARVDQVLHQLRQKGWLKNYYASRKGEAIYTLSNRGLRQVGEKPTAKSPSARITHHLVINDVLVHCVRHFGINGWEWYERPEGSEVIPMVKVEVNTIQWCIEVDNGTKLSHQLYNTCQQYLRQLRQSVKPKKVLFVAQTGERKQYLRNRVVGLSSEGLRFSVCNLDQVADVLQGTTVEIG